MTTRMADTHETRLSAMPDLFRRLLDQPLHPLTRARLPVRDALYVFYQDEEPILVGSPPHVEEVRLLAPSVRLSQKIGAHGPRRASKPSPAMTRKPVSARWLPLEDEDDRMLLELYAAQSLGLSVSHPRIRQGLTGA